MLMMTFHLTVTLLAGLAASGQARTLQVGYRTQAADARDLQDDDYTYGDLTFHYDGVERERETTAVWGDARPVIHVLPRPQQGGGRGHQGLDTLYDPFDYSYTYGDYTVDYEVVPHARPTGSGGGGGDGDGHHPQPSGVIPEVEEEDLLLPRFTVSPHDSHDHSPSPAEGVDDDGEGVDDDEGVDEDDERFEDDEEEEYSAISRLLQWLQDRLSNPGKTTTQMVERLREVKESVSNFLYQLKEAVEMGRVYCVQKLRAATRGIYSGGKKPLDKLLLLLRQKNENVVDLFRLLGIKVQEWLGLRQRERQGTASPTPQHRDDGNGDDSLAGNTTERDNIEMMPNFFKDAAVSGKLHQLLQEGSLTEEELEALLEAP